jgi:hypothetical protein
MVATDLLLGLHDTVLFTWSGLLVFAFLGLRLREHRSTPRVALAALAGSTLFFIWTNFGVWLVSGMYPTTAAGLERCYVMALPFFRNSVLGDLAFTGALFAAWELLRLRAPRPAVFADSAV